MNDHERLWLRSLKWHGWVTNGIVAAILAVFLVVFVLVVRYLDLEDIRRCISESKCSCQMKDHVQHNNQSVNFAPVVRSREDTVSEQLKRKWDNRHADMQ